MEFKQLRNEVFSLHALRSVSVVCTNDAGIPMALIPNADYHDKITFFSYFDSYTDSAWTVDRSFVHGLD